MCQALIIKVFHEFVLMLCIQIPCEQNKLTFELSPTVCKGSNSNPLLAGLTVQSTHSELHLWPLPWSSG